MIRPAVLTLAVGATLYAMAPNPLRIVDGDTIAIGPDRYRLATIDAPELYRPRCAREEALAVLAKQRLHELTRGDYSLEHVPCAYRFPGERNKDRYGRTCIILRVPSAIAGVEAWQDVGETMVREGLAVPFEKGKRPSWCSN